MPVFEVIAEVRMHIDAENLESAEDTATDTLNEVVADIINIDVKS
jgi:hypothetical protein